MAAVAAACCAGVGAMRGALPFVLYVCLRAGPAPAAISSRTATAAVPGLSVSAGDLVRGSLVLRCKGGAAGPRRGKKILHNDDPDSDDAVREITSDWLQAARQSAANARRLKERSLKQQHDEFVQAKMKLPDPENETECDPLYMRNVSTIFLVSCHVQSKLRPTRI